MSGYLYDPHTHTTESSACADLSAAESVECYAKMGFSGFVVTDHIHPEYIDRIDTQHNWDTVIDHYLTGYRIAKKRGEELGMDVILGVELRFEENDNDYLLYGVDEAWLRANPYPCTQTAQEFYARHKDEILIIQAHPYRNGNLTVFEHAFHGVETINAHPRHQNHNDLAIDLCRRHPEYLRLAGSDTHRPEDAGRAGVILPQRVRNSFDYKEMIESGKFRLWSPPFESLAKEVQNMGRKTKECF